MYEPNEQENTAINLLDSEKTNWEEGQTWVTDKVSFIMRNVIKQARKNYFGIYDNQLDPITGRKKIYVPMTEWIVETVLKNIDIDTKDIEVYGKNPKASKSAGIFKHILRSVLDNTRFGITLNQALRNCVIDGTAVFKVWVEKEKGEKKELCIKAIDRLNILCDPSAPSLDESGAVIERNVLSLPELKEYKNDWENVDEVRGTFSVDRTGIEPVNTGDNTSEIPYVEVYERYGYFDKFILTGKESDRDEYVYGLIVVSGLNETPIVHKIKEVKGHPYQEIKFKDLINRFDGRGIPEMIFDIQAYVNEIVNIRLNNARISQTNLWRVGPSVTPQQLKQLFITGAIKAQQGEIESLNTGTVDPSSYKDEDTAYDWAQRVTQSQNESDVADSRPATNALIEQRGANKAYGLVMENIFMALGKMIEEKVIPAVIEILDDEEIVKITGDPADLDALAEPYARNLVRKQYDDYWMQTARPLYISEEEEDALVQQTLQALAKDGKIRYVTFLKDAFSTEYDITVDPASEEVNRGIMVKQLTDAAGTLGSLGVPASELKDVFKEIFDGLGLQGEKLVEKIQAQPQAQPMDTSLSGAMGQGEMIPPTEGQLAPTV